MIPLNKKTAKAVPTIAKMAMAVKPLEASGLYLKTSSVSKAKNPIIDGIKTIPNPPAAT
mgnify:CR=1 FL=1